MRSGTAQTAARPIYYDRNPLTKTGYYNATIAPAGSTQRWSYTVPSGKKCFVEGLLVSSRRATAAAPVGIYYSLVNYTPAGGSAQNAIIAQSVDNTVNALARDTLPAWGLMLEGDILAGFTSDASTGGTVNYLNSFKGAEFDA